jgi:PIN domain nuclease of toxin-antitoxin system
VIEAILDASALIAFLRNETGAERVREVLTKSGISTVNLSETLGKMVEYGNDLETAAYQVERLRIAVIPFDAEQARIAASLWKTTRSVGMSLGDRACLAVALQTSLPAFTTEKTWGECGIGAKIVRIR